MYNWLWTMAFVSGTTPAIILLVACFVCSLYFNLVMNRLGRDEKSLSNLSLTPLSPSHEPPIQGRSFKFTVWAIFLFNILGVGTVNALYVWSTLLDIVTDVRLWIQLSFALFSSLWSIVLRRTLPSQIKESRYGVWLFISLDAMNKVFIPCIVTALSTPSCFKVFYFHLLFASDYSRRSRFGRLMIFPPRTRINAVSSIGIR
jgi:hypothetical protein